MNHDQKRKKHKAKLRKKKENLELKQRLARLEDAKNFINELRKSTVFKQMDKDERERLESEIRDG